jgi:hypothetical protein
MRTANRQRRCLEKFLIIRLEENKGSPHWNQALTTGIESRESGRISSETVSDDIPTIVIIGKV